MLIEVLALGVALLAGLRPWHMIVLGLVLFAPVLLVPAIFYVVVTGRRTLDDRAPLFCDAVASELRAGSNLRSALFNASASVSIDLAISTTDGSLGVDQIAVAVASHLPSLGAELVATVEAVALSGSAAADLFDELAAHAISRTEVVREVRVATAPARATAWFFLIAPVGFMILQATRGSMGDLFAEPAQRITASVGALLFAGGLASMMLLIRRAG